MIYEKWIKNFDIWKRWYESINFLIQSELHLRKIVNEKLISMVYSNEADMNWKILLDIQAIKSPF